MRAPTHLAVALLFSACAQATPGGLPPQDLPGQPDAGSPDPDRPDADPPQLDATPATPDALVQVPASAPLLNEFVADHIGIDTNEFVEILGQAATDYSSFSILVIEGDAAAGPGIIDRVLPVGTTDSDGLFVTAFGSNIIENGTITLLLVDGFSGAAGSDIDADDDGAIDNEPWAEVANAVAVADGDPGDLTYAGSAVLTPDFDGGTARVGGASRIPDGQDTGAADDWTRNNFEGHGLSCCSTATAEPGEAINTPGIANAMTP